MAKTVRSDTLTREIFLPRSYQSEGLDWALDRERCGWWWEPGLGKTPSTLLLLANRFNALEIHRTLIVAPKRVTLFTWPIELGRWEHAYGMDYTILRDSDRPSFIKLMNDGKPLHLVSYDWFKRVVKYWARKGRWPYDMVVLDESTKLKSPSSKNYYAAASMSRRTPYILLLTGTPAPNGLLDIWTQTMILDGGKRLFPTYTDYKTNWFYPADYHGYRWEPRGDTEVRVHELVADLYHSLSAREELGLPPEIPPHDIEVEIPLQARIVYDQFAEEFFAWVEGAGGIEAANAAVASMKIRQIANGGVYDEDGKWHQLHDEKLDALLDLLDEVQQPVLLAYQFVPDLVLLRRKLQGRLVVLDDKIETLHRWNRGEISVLAAHAAGAAHGLNLAEGGHITVWYGIDWALETYLQFNERLGDTRQRQIASGVRPIVHRILAANSVEDLVRERLLGKRSTQEILKDSVRQRQRNVACVG